MQFHCFEFVSNRLVSKQVLYRHDHDDVALFTTCIWMTTADDALKLLTVSTFLETDQGGIKEAAPIILLFIQVLKKQVINFQERILSDRDKRKWLFL